LQLLAVPNGESSPNSILWLMVWTAPYGISVPE
jgi:hypothetical protein